MSGKRTGRRGSSFAALERREETAAGAKESPARRMGSGEEGSTSTSSLEGGRGGDKGVGDSRVLGEAGASSTALAFPLSTLGRAFSPPATAPAFSSSSKRVSVSEALEGSSRTDGVATALRWSSLSRRAIRSETLAERLGFVRGAP